MRAPTFWQHPEPSTVAKLLAPIGSVVGAIAGRRMARRADHAGVPVICVGNFVAGGAGKTPTAITIAKDLIAHGEHPMFLSRGYGGARRAVPLLVDLAEHAAEEVGDEPLLLARIAPTVVTRDRAAGARFAIQHGASVIVMDDGLQSRHLEPDLSFGVVDAAVGIGNGLCLPAGPLRARLSVQLRHVAAIVLVGEGSGAAKVASEAARAGVPVFCATLVPDGATLERLRGKRLLAFAGIGRPEKFFKTLRDAGLDVAATMAFPDHHRFRDSDITTLQTRAAHEALTLVSTEKDAVRLVTPTVESLPVNLVFDDVRGVEALIARALARARSRPAVPTARPQP